MITVVKLFGALFLILGGIILLKFELKDRKKQGSLSEIVSKSVSFQGFILSIILILTGIGLIISCFNE